VGKHTMDVWHGRFEPVAKSIEFEIKADEDTEVLVQFRTPDFLKPKKS